jgi:hypothetical protein
VLAVGAYATAVTVAILLLGPVLFAGHGEAASIAKAPEALTYQGKPGETLAGIAAENGLSVARLFALNPGLTPLTRPAGKQLIIGLR